jgi:hypothetical protein
MPDERWQTELNYEQLPRLVKDNISLEQWSEAQRAVIAPGAVVPESTDYINLKNGQIHGYAIGDEAEAPLLASHDLAGGGGKDSTQFRTAPQGSHDVP